jgi:hypothetical protein
MGERFVTVSDENCLTPNRRMLVVMPDTFELETRDGIRRIEFDPDPLRRRDVRLLQDGRLIGSMLHPTAEAPHKELEFALGEHRLTAVAETRDRGLSLTFDLFADGRSLSGGPPLEAARQAAPTQSRPYPTSFQIIDRTLLIAPAAAAPGFSVGAMGGADRLGIPAVIAIIVLGLIAIGIATGIARVVWKRIVAKEHLTVRMRTLYGGLALAGTYAVAFGTMLFGLVALIGTGGAAP